MIAALNGHTVGSGLEIAMAADLRIARRGAGKIGLRRSTSASCRTGGTSGCPGWSARRGDRAMVTGRTFGPTGEILGIVDDVYDADSATRSWTGSWVREAVPPPNAASKAIGHIKRAVQTGWELPIGEALAVERELQQLLFQSADAREGLAAYVEKRKPQFTGN